MCLVCRAQWRQQQQAAPTAAAVAPAPAEVLGWVEAIVRDAGEGEALSDAQLDVVIGALLTLGALEPSPEREAALDRTNPNYSNSQC